jgi:hypothetical protein
LNSQRELPEIGKARITIQAPLISLAAFSDITGWAQSCVTDAIDYREIPRQEDRIGWAFNIATRRAGQKEVRVLSHLTEPSKRETLVGDEVEWPFVLELIFPVNRHKGRHPAQRIPFILGTELQYAMSCREQHITRLIKDDKVLALIPETRVSSGPSGSPMITFESIKAFLKSRRLP